MISNFPEVFNFNRLLLKLNPVHLSLAAGSPCSLNRNKDDSNVATGVNYGVDASFSSWPKSICDPKTRIVRIKRTPKTTTFFWRWSTWTSTDKPTDTYLPQGKPLGFHMGGWKYIVPLWLSGPRVIGCTRNQVIGTSPIQALLRP